MNHAGAAGAYRYRRGRTTRTRTEISQVCRIASSTRRPDQGEQLLAVVLDSARSGLGVRARVISTSPTTSELTGQAMFTRTSTETSLGLTADNITFWGAPIPFGDNVYTGDALRGIPSSLNFGRHDERGLPARRPIRAQLPRHRRLHGEAGLARAARGQRAVPDAVRPSPGSATAPGAPLAQRAARLLERSLGPRGGKTVTDTSQFSLGAEGDFESGDHHWDVNLSMGFTDNLATPTSQDTKKKKTPPPPPPKNENQLLCDEMSTSST